MNKNQKRTLATLAALAITLAVVNASVFVYYDLDVSIIGTTAEVRFATGDNANHPDLAGQTITITLEGTYKTKATIEIHPTNEKTYYRNVLVIENYGVGHIYHGWIKVNTPVSSQGITSAKLYIKNSPSDTPDDAIAEIDLTSKTLQGDGFQIPAATSSGSPPTITPGKLYIDIVIEINRNVDAGAVSGTAQLELIYSPQYSETPP